MKHLTALLLLSASLTAAEPSKVFVYAEPDPALGGMVSAALTDSAGDIKDYIERTVSWRDKKVVSKRSDATMLVQVTSRSIVNEEYRVQVHVTLADGTQRDLTGTDVRQWKRCALQIVSALREMSKAQQASH